MKKIPVLLLFVLAALSMVLPKQFNQEPMFTVFYFLLTFDAAFSQAVSWASLENRRLIVWFSIQR